MRPGKRLCQCTSCGEFFGGLSAFDAHRVRVNPERPFPRRCLAPDEMGDGDLRPHFRADGTLWVSDKVQPIALFDKKNA